MLRALLMEREGEERGGGEIPRIDRPRPRRRFDGGCEGVLLTQPTGIDLLPALNDGAWRRNARQLAGPCRPHPVQPAVTGVTPLRGFGERVDDALPRERRERCGALPRGLFPPRVGEGVPGGIDGRPRERFRFIKERELGGIGALL
jgi:hypothetical protein